MNEREANQMLSVYASYIRAGNAKEAGELATNIVRLLAAAGMSAEGGEAKYEGRAFCDGAWLPWHPISVEVYENRQKWPRDGYEVRASLPPESGSRTQVEQRQEGGE